MDHSEVYLLREDPDLGEQIPEVELPLAARALRVRASTAPPGHWMPPEVDVGCIGLLLLKGLMVHKIVVGKAAYIELVGPGDIARPWQEDPIAGLISPLSEWIVLEEVRVAVLDADFAWAVGEWPALGAAVSERLVRRLRSLTYLIAAHSLPRLDDRLLATLWHLASTWGRVVADGIRIPFALTDEKLGEIVSAQPRSVTVSLRMLHAQGRISRDEQRCCVVHGQPPDWSDHQLPIAELEPWRCRTLDRPIRPGFRRR